ncbi:GNAT family N-acetyltransferase [Streptomyces sp. NPDC006733]|uniref:GNAT family N-acetyltransferase n=1 Tax=Streptomyces sp. NPDC006733 TaxID=3155460 RepID=UPI0033E1E406
MTPPEPDRGRPVADDQVRIVPADEASWDDLRAIFGTADYASKCQCQRFKILGDHWTALPLAERAERLREQTGCDDAGASSTSGLVAYLDGEPAGWCAVEPRTAFPRLARMRVPWTGRQEDKADDGVWAVTCLIVRKGFRGRGLTYPLARATIGFARERGARAIEAYPMITRPDVEITWGELHVGSRNVFADAGFAEVSAPTLRRVVMRVDFRAERPVGTA